MLINAPKIVARIKLTASERRAVRYYFEQWKRERPATPRGQLWADACRHVFFRKDLSATVRAYKKRSTAAKRGWKKRKQG